jgi:Protein of unknown function (DUF3460)
VTMYESELTRFMREYLAQHPEEVASQKLGRAAWWDKDPAKVAPPPPRHAPRSGGAEYTFQPLTEKDAEEK